LGKLILASEAAHDISGQCIGLGGDKLSLWSHPQETRSVYRAGGWSAEQIAEVWSDSLGQQMQSYGLPAFI